MHHGRWLVIALSVISLAACNAILGISDVPEPNAADAGSSGDTSSDVTSSGANDTGDAAADVVLPIPDGASPASWARWPMPNPPDGGGLLGTDFDYATGDGGVVTDKRTNLVWGLRAGAAQSNDFDAAIRYCDGYEPGVKWRLPSRIELVTLIDYTRTNPAIDTVHFPPAEVPAGWYWTSSVVRPPTLPYRFWAIDFATGAVSDSPPLGVRNLLCVKGPEAG